MTEFAAERFADFVTDEIDPAMVLPAESVDLNARWRSPVTELLNWRDTIGMRARGDFS